MIENPTSHSIISIRVNRPLKLKPQVEWNPIHSKKRETNRLIDNAQIDESNMCTHQAIYYA